MALDGFTAATIAVLAVLIGGMVVHARRRRRRRHELHTDANHEIAELLATPEVRGGGEPRVAAADEVAERSRRAEGALRELERISRSETAAAARDLRVHTVALAGAIESRLRGTGDPYVLGVRIVELRERVRGALQRLRAAVGD